MEQTPSVHVALPPTGGSSAWPLPFDVGDCPLPGLTSLDLCWPSSKAQSHCVSRGIQVSRFQQDLHPWLFSPFPLPLLVISHFSVQGCWGPSSLPPPVITKLKVCHMEDLYYPSIYWQQTSCCRGDCSVVLSSFILPLPNNERTPKRNLFTPLFIVFFVEVLIDTAWARS